MQTQYFVRLFFALGHILDRIEFLKHLREGFLVRKLKRTMHTSDRANPGTSE